MWPLRQATSTEKGALRIEILEPIGQRYERPSAEQIEKDIIACLGKPSLEPVNLPVSDAVDEQPMPDTPVESANDFSSIKSENDEELQKKLKESEEEKRKLAEEVEKLKESDDKSKKEIILDMYNNKGKGYKDIYDLISTLTDKMSSEYKWKKFDQTIYVNDNEEPDNETNYDLFINTLQIIAVQIKKQ